MNRFDAVNTPTCLERDFNIPSLEELLKEVGKIREIQMNSSSSNMMKKANAYA